MSDSIEPLQQFRNENARVEVYRSAATAGRAAAVQAARLIQRAITEQGRARVIAATGNSQIPVADALVEQDIDWKAVELFHMDEYAGIKPDHPSSFRYWIRTRLEEKAHPGVAHYLDGDAPALIAEMNR
jgi:glucosamine-6-phosphate deaminase